MRRDAPYDIEPEQTMNSSAGDNSTAKTVTPFATPPEQFHSPRLGIIHLLAWTAAAAALMKLAMALGWLGSLLGDVSRLLRIIFITVNSVQLMAFAASIVGTAVILHARFRGVPGRLQAGHWMLVVATSASVLTLLLWVLLSVGHDFLVSESPWLAYYCLLAIQGSTNLLLAILWLVVILRMRESPRWKALFGFFVARNVICCFIYLVAIFFETPFYSFRDLAEQPVGSAVGLFALPLVVLIDLRHHVSRDWLHWLGVAIIFTFEAICIAQFLAMKFLQ